MRLQTCTALLNWRRYTNSADDCELTVRVVPVPIETPEEQKAGKAFMRFGREVPIYERVFKVSGSMDLGVCWKLGKDLHSSEQIGGEILQKLVEAVTKSQ